MTDRQWNAERGGPNVVVIRAAMSSPGSTFSVLLRSDVHWDNAKCCRELEIKHLEQAKQRGAAIIDCGDLFCAMQGKYDRRSSRRSVRPEHDHDGYLSALVSTAIDYYTPYAQQFAVFGTGNHETSILDKNGVDLTGDLASGLRARGSPVIRNGYSGWVVFRLERGNARKTFRLWYHHGYGGGGPVTMDVIQGANRQPVYVENADIMVSGHTHDAWYVEKVRHRLNQEYQIERRSLHILKLSTYKDAWGVGAGGFEVEKGHPPKPLGAWWLKFTQGERDQYDLTVERAS